MRAAKSEKHKTRSCRQSLDCGCAGGSRAEEQRRRRLPRPLPFLVSQVISLLRYVYFILFSKPCVPGSTTDAFSACSVVAVLLKCFMKYRYL